MDGFRVIQVCYIYCTLYLALDPEVGDPYSRWYCQNWFVKALYNWLKQIRAYINSQKYNRNQPKWISGSPDLGKYSVLSLFRLPLWLRGRKNEMKSAYNAGATGDVGLIPGWGISLEEDMATHSGILAWRISWIEEPGGLQSIGSQGWTHLKWLSTHACKAIWVCLINIHISLALSTLSILLLLYLGLLKVKLMLSLLQNLAKIQKYLGIKYFHKL